MRPGYVSLDGVSKDTLEFLGYYLVAENDDFEIYYHLADEIIVEKSDRLLYVEDANDLPYFAREIISLPSEHPGDA